MGTYAKQVEFLNVPQVDPTTGSVYADGYVKVLLAGTSTLATVYSARDKGGTFTNPFQLDSDQTKEVYLDGVFDIEIYEGNPSAAGVKKDTIYGLEYTATSGVVAVVSTISDLRNETPKDGDSLQVLGYYESGDGGGGPVRVAKTGAAPGTYVDNGGSIIVPTGGDGSAAWVWKWSGLISPMWYGQSGLLSDVAGLRNTPGYKNTSVYVNNFGLYRWNESSTVADDGLNVIKVNGTTTGRWLLAEQNLSRSDVTLALATSGGEEKSIGQWLSRFDFKPRLMRPPADFDWPGSSGSQIKQMSFSVRRDASGHMTLDYHIWRPPSVVGASAVFTTYYVAPAGDDTNDGLSPSTPFKTLDKALSIAAARDIVLEPGHYDITNAWTLTPTSQRSTIRVDGDGRAVLYYGIRTSSWTNEGGGVYSTPVTGTVVNVVETRFYDDNGVPLAFMPYATVAELSAVTTGGWAVDTGVVYVKLPEVSGVYAAPTNTNTFVLYSDESPTITGGTIFHVKGIEFWGGASAFNFNSSATTMYFEDCDFAYSAGNGADIDNAIAGIFFKNCRAFCNKADGFNYHNSGGINGCYALEFNCAAFGNGLYNDTGINNASTNHDEGRVIRVGGVYGNSNGPIIADINSSQSWNVGISAFNSLTAGGVQASIEAWGPSGGAKVWVEDCHTYGSTYDLYAHGGGKIYYRNLISDGAFFEETSGDITEF